MALEKWVLVKLSGKVEESMLSEPLKGILGKNKLRGVLSSFNNEKITLQTQGVQVELPLLMIKKITLDPDV